MSEVSNLLKISKAVDMSEIWLSRVQTAFDLVGLEMTRTLFVKLTAEVADNLKFHKTVTEFHDQETGEVVITEEDNVLGPIDDSDVSDDDIVEAMHTIVDVEVVERQNAQYIADLETRVSDLEGENVNLTNTLNLYKASLDYHESVDKSTPLNPIPQPELEF